MRSYESTHPGLDQEIERFFEEAREKLGRRKARSAHRFPTDKTILFLSDMSPRPWSYTYANKPKVLTLFNQFEERFGGLITRKDFESFMGMLKNMLLIRFHRGDGIYSRMWHLNTRWERY